jgi:hypothetical protein
VTTSLLSLLPDELRNLHFETELDRLSRDLREEDVKARLNVSREHKRTALPARSSAVRGSASTRLSKAQLAQRDHDSLVRKFGSGYCHH